MDDDHPPRRHHRQRPGVRQQHADQLIAARRIARFVGVETLDVERLQPFVDDVRELDREIVA